MKDPSKSSLPGGFRSGPSFVRRAFVRLLAAYYRIVPVPKDFKSAITDTESTTIVTESTSIIVEALLYSFAQRTTFKSCIHLGINSSRERSPDSIYWVAHFEKEALTSIVTGDRKQKFVTLNIFSGRGPYRNNPSYTLGFWDLFGILIMGRFLIIFLGSPIQATINVASIHSALVRHLRLDFYKNLKLVRGTPFQPIETQAKIVMGGLEFMSELQQLSEKTRVPLPKLARKAESAFYDIAANPRRPMYRIVAFIAGLIIRRLFSAVRAVGMERLIPAVKESTVVIVPMHRSHLDYILLGYTLYDSKLNPPLVAAGVNLSFWPAGFIIRSVGGYFVKRNVRNDRLHALLLKRYVTYLVKRGHLQEFFIEGGRSRSGRMRPPKLGLLSIFAEAHLKGYKRDIVFVPVSISYENLIEDAVFGQENTGRSKEKENLISLLKARKIFRQKYGDVTINFGEPISLSRHLQKTRKVGDGRTAIVDLAHQITVSIREQTNPSLTSLAHTALLMAPRYGLNRAQLVEAIRNLAKLISVLRPAYPLMGDFTPSLDQFLCGKETILSDIMRGDSIQVRPCLDGEVFYIPGERRFVADFYKNATLHLLFEVGLLSICDLTAGDSSPENCLPYYRVFRHDFLLGGEQEYLNKLSRTAALLKEAGVIGVHNNKSLFSDRSNGIFLPALLLPSIECLVWCVQNLEKESRAAISNVSATTGKSPPVVDYDTLMQKMQNDFRASVYLGVMHSTEASSMASLASALETLQALGAIALMDQAKGRRKIIVQNLHFPELQALKSALVAIRRWHSVFELEGQTTILGQS